MFRYIFCNILYWFVHGVSSQLRIMFGGHGIKKFWNPLIRILKPSNALALKYQSSNYTESMTRNWFEQAEKFHQDRQ